MLETERDDAKKTITFQAIGHVENEFDEPETASVIRAARSRIILQPDLTPGLQGIEPDEELMVIFYFDRSEGYELLQHPCGDPEYEVRGVFALRSPNRPNPIGVTTVELLAIEDNILHVRGLDAINGTPVLDLKLVDLKLE
ncbi:MAG TPA: tRNA (N6-threonylcarbamoyladenosine(37)-N6)-methyltransferase TrmO [Candidatus Sulfomarinibacteraceae bacterium]|nr:tRNA (N6-threonylcarbamoyladenosine(37)-N6)-methyltransferase TrmO [Candidatus Sulfomarinibacteraceae bacterium]